MGRDENVEIFNDTEELCKTNKKIRESVKKAKAYQKLILESDNLPDQKKDLYGEKAKVVISKKRSFEAAAGYKSQKVMVHNFASATGPGGGVTRGATAQEECLCRCSGLYFCLNTQAMWDGFYKPHRNANDPINNGDIIYTPGITVFKSDTANPQLMPESDWYDVDIVTCAAPKLRQVKIKDKELQEIHEKRLRRILEVSLANGRDTVILGAFGCGAFQNNPEAVAAANRNVIKDYLHAFKNIEFAVYCSPRDDQNYRIFNRVLKEFC